MRSARLIVAMTLFFVIPVLFAEKNPPGPRITEKPTEKPDPQKCGCRSEYYAAEEARGRVVECIGWVKRDYPGRYNADNLDFFYRECFAGYITAVNTVVTCEKKCSGRKACLDEFKTRKEDMDRAVDAALENPFATELKNHLAQKLSALNRMCLSK